MSHTVYRIERPNGDGPFARNIDSCEKVVCEPADYDEPGDMYVKDAQGNKLCETTWTPESHPTPYEDGMFWVSEHIFACHTKDDLLHWFPDDFLLALDECGYVLSVYEIVPLKGDVIFSKSGKQLAFRRPLGRLVKRQAIIDAF